MSKTILGETDGFIPVIDDLITDTCLMTAVVFGKVWRYCQMKDGVCKASMERLAKETGLTIPTFRKHVDSLLEKGYLIDTTPDLKGHPHIFADTGKAGITIQIKAGNKNSLQPEAEQM